MLVRPLILFRLIEISVLNTMHIINQLMNRKSDNMCLVPYNFDPEYSVEEINSSQLLIGETTAQLSSLSFR